MKNENMINENTIKTITSATNPLIQRIVKLHSAKYRKTYKEFMAEGIHIISTLIEAQHKPTHVLTTEKMFFYTKRFFAHDSVVYENIVIVTEAIMKKISTQETPTGIIALFSIPAEPEYGTLSSGIVLANVQNPGNAGTLIRTAVAMNKKTAVFIGGVDPFNPKVIQASAGTIGSINIFQLDWQDLIAHKKSIPLYALVASGGKKPQAINMRDSLIVVGNEGAGLADEDIAQCDDTITLNMPGPCESLNASIAGAIALYLSAS